MQDMTPSEDLSSSDFSNARYAEYPPIHTSIQKRAAQQSWNQQFAKKRITSTPTPNNIPTSNRFQVLSNYTLDGSQQHIIPKEKIPPFFIKNLEDFTAFTTALTSACGNIFLFENKGKNVKVITNTSEDYRKVRKFFDNEKILYYTYCLPSDRKLSIVIKNLPTSIPEEAIVEELKNLKYPVIKVTRLCHPDQTPMPLVAAILEDSDTGNDIFNLKHLLHCIVKVEPRRKPTGPPRCRRCQQPGHTKNYCSLIPICIKCLDPHLTTDCPLPANSPPKCIHCRKTHSPNSQNCKSNHYPSQSLNDNNNTKPRHTQSPSALPLPSHPPPSPFRPFTPSNHLNSHTNHRHTTYAQAAASSASRPSSSLPHNFPLTNSINDISSLINSIVSQVIAAIMPIIQSSIQSMLSSMFSNGSK